MNKDEFDSENEHTSFDQGNDKEITLKMQQLLLTQDFAVLCTRSDKMPYGSLVAFVADNNFCNIIFATLDYTRKYQLLKQCDQVAMLIDDRDQHKERISRISALTINGAAEKIENFTKIKNAKQMLLSKHNYLNELVSSESCVFFNVCIARYLYVTHLQEVYEWIPNSSI